MISLTERISLSQYGVALNFASPAFNGDVRTRWSSERPTENAGLIRGYGRRYNACARIVNSTGAVAPVLKRYHCANFSRHESRLNEVLSW